MRATKEHIPQLDGLRGVAVLVVIISHCANAGFLPHFFGKGFGQQGVALFYMLSGYLMFYLYLERDCTRSNIIRYLTARFARVLPLFFAVILFATFFWVTTGYIFYGFKNTWQLLGNILLIQGTSVLWSIPVEIQFYIVFVAFWWIYSLGRVRTAFTALIAIQAVLLIATKNHALPIKEGYSLPYWLHLFALGGLASFLNPNLKAPDWMGIIAIFAFPVSLPEVRRMMDWPVLPNYIDPISVGYPALIFFLVLLKAHAFRFLSHPALRFVGQISFGAYLFHWPFILIASHLEINSIYAFFLVLGATLIFAHVSMHLYERPMQSILRSGNGK